MPSAMEEIENVVNDMINTMRRIDAMAEDSQFAANHPKLRELAHRLGVQMEHSKRRMADKGFAEPEPGQPEPGSPSATTLATPEDVLSSPYAGEEPRYAVQHRSGGPGTTVSPDPIEKAGQTPQAEVAGRTDPNDPRPNQPQPEKAQAKRDGSDSKADAKKK